MGNSIRTNKKDFSKSIEDYVQAKGSSYIDAVLYMCEISNIEPDASAKLISKPIREKLEVEGRKINLLPKRTFATIVP